MSLVLENTEKRDTLIAYEKKIQQEWRDSHLFEVNAPSADEVDYNDLDSLHEKYPKWFGCMAYPYMNGYLHAGHAFTLSKVDFDAGVQRLLGNRTLFPMGFHCTGMPIKASADKLIREMELFGPNFDQNQDDDDDDGEESLEPSQSATPTTHEDVTKFTTKKSKAEAKKGNAKYQYQIMLQLGIPREDIKKFTDTAYWLEYFPPVCRDHCNAIGAGIDWRRSFITTDANPYYDAFVRWQVNRLHNDGKIKFGKRYTIYSVKDGQPCMDHDRASGEGVRPQEYTAIKIRLLSIPEKLAPLISALDSSSKIYLIAATLRPETMYGQTCCFVSPSITYGLYKLNDSEYVICTERAAKNMSYQDIFPEIGNYTSHASIPGSALIGAKIHAPFSVYKEVYVLPMETIKEGKGTGVVTCVPSDSPDDYITTLDLQKKPEYYGIKAEWVAHEPAPIIETPTYGNLTAVTLVEQLKIQSPKDAVLLAKAKELAYKEGYYQGVMHIGKYKGLKVEDAKPKVRQDLIDAGEAFVYNEPEGLVMSRSGDECIVALEDQWYFDYGEPKWKADVLECLADLNTFNDETRHGFEATLDWLNNWAFSRTYGLGTRVPWDPKYLVESLSDSTVYMSYYTIARFLHKDLYGKEPTEYGILPEHMTDEVFDYIFYHADQPPSSAIPVETMDLMRHEFAFFYPLDVRVSGKDLIQNHLSFFLYCHVALFPRKFWPRGIRCNGHLLLNNQKMSKSTGNFLTMSDMVDKFGADAARLALADAGDGIEDANFDETTANTAILRLYTVREWCEQQVVNADKFRTNASCPEAEFFDAAFENELNQLILETIGHYKTTSFKSALKSGLYDLQAAREYYRESCASSDAIQGMRRDLVLRYIEVQALLMTPLMPHWSEYLYKEVLKKEGSVHSAKFPEISKPLDNVVLSSLSYVRNLCRSIREVEGANLKKKSKGKTTTYDLSKPSKVTVYVADAFPQWQEKYLDLVREAFESMELTGDGKSDELTKKVQQAAKEAGGSNEMKKAMPFVNNIKSRLKSEAPEHVFDRKLAFDEVATIRTAMPVLRKAINSCQEFQVIFVKEGESEGRDMYDQSSVAVSGKAAEGAVPGQPGITVTNV
ncbi:hypothetical protein CANCADRAFT_125746 [Tortispora caseinolytica NRRL Y-17796]|uniref:leucine--tRNA ligase n=1 Tax=Tortispora caseinolytica NRRL Y-17796 TaxID=767744 RepID=A0A1E4TA44_9ASCO|nr:hypothetical protein CANCADRAFT_125746 [Tortispora caseinolytica NRRL Y-17796]